MTKRKYQKPVKIEMDFEEALKRFGTTDPSELPDDIKISQRHRHGSDNVQSDAEVVAPRARRDKED